MHIIVEVCGNSSRNIGQSDSWTNAFTTAWAWSNLFPKYKYLAINAHTGDIARYVNGIYVEE